MYLCVITADMSSGVSVFYDAGIKKEEYNVRRMFKKCQKTGAAGA